MDEELYRAEDSGPSSSFDCGHSIRRRRPRAGTENLRSRTADRVKCSRRVSCLYIPPLGRTAWPTSPMRNRITVTVLVGLITTVVGGLILAVILKSSDLFAKVASRAWGTVTWILDTLASSHSIPGWAILAAGTLALFGLIIISILVKEALHIGKEHPSRNYTEDMLDGARWRWIWIGNKITKLWCFCPTCDAQLVYSEYFAETRLICERCPSDGSIAPPGSRGRLVATVMGGNRDYAVAAAEREIRRRIRTGEC